MTLEKLGRNESINHPEYYAGDREVETIDLIRKMGLAYGFCLGSCIKYVDRAGRKDKSIYITDIQKGIFYLKYIIEHKLEPISSNYEIFDFEVMANDHRWEEHGRYSDIMHGVYMDIYKAYGEHSLYHISRALEGLNNIVTRYNER